jgi:hypothetical protein
MPHAATSIYLMSTRPMKEEIRHHAAMSGRLFFHRVAGSREAGRFKSLLRQSTLTFSRATGRTLAISRRWKQLSSNITGISLDVLRGRPLAECTIEERMMWAKSRTTKREEDHVYSLFGIFDVTMPLVYGEGKAKAFRRFYEEISRYSK